MNNENIKSRELRNKLGKEILFFDGGFGTMLQARGLAAGTPPEMLNVTEPSKVVAVHREYIEAGADIIKLNTFGANFLRHPQSDAHPADELIRAAVACAAQAAKEAGKSPYVALDVGPLGKLVGKGELDFEDAVRAFADVVRVGAEYCDLVLLETFGDIAEVRAALIAVKENCALPVVVTCVFDADGKTFTGSDVESMVCALDALGADAVGMNCSTGPREMLPLVPRFALATDLPVAVNPNAGLPRMLPNGKAEYDLTADEFAYEMRRIVEAGATLVGGCCGTTPEFIKKSRLAVADATCVTRGRRERPTAVSSPVKRFVFGGKTAVIGERINPTGKPKFKAALKSGDFDYAVAEAHNEAACGADLLDVNVGIPDVDEPTVLTRTVENIQSVCSLPLQIDTSDPVAMERALRRYNGKALINSVNGSEKSLSTVLPLAAKYGGVIIALTLDENGIPDTAEGRYAIAEKIVARAAEYGIPREDIIADPLTLTLGADPAAAEKTLSALRMIKSRLGIKTSLGISNVSFGLPDRDRVNCDFLCAAIDAGLDAAIMNPCSAPMMAIARGNVKNADEAMAALSASIKSAASVESTTDDLTGCIYGGLAARAAKLAAEECDKMPPTEVISRLVVPALERAGGEFERGKMFLPALLACADAAISALSVISDRMLSSSVAPASKNKVVLATVEGDVHDIGKNIVGVMLKSYGFEVVDLGRDVPPATVAEALETTGASLLGLSALMTTTVPSMRRTIEIVRATHPNVKIVVGGAVLTEEYAASVGADRYAPDAMATVRFAAEVYGQNGK